MLYTEKGLEADGPDTRLLQLQGRGVGGVAKSGANGTERNREDLGHILRIKLTCLVRCN